MQLSNTFYIRRTVYQQMIEYCKRELPFEGCGLLSGKGNSGYTVWPLPNENKGYSRFSISEKTIAATVKRMKNKGENLTGVFHSHPTTSAYPSISDIRNNPYADIAYLIISFVNKNPSIGCFKIIDQKKVEKIKLEILEY